MSSSSESEADEKTVILQSIARSTDAVIQSQKSNVAKVKKRQRQDEDDNEPMVLDALQLRLREALDKRLEMSIMPRFKKSKMNKRLSGELTGLDEGTEGSTGANGGVRLFGKVPCGTPANLETQSSLMERRRGEKTPAKRRMSENGAQQENGSSSTSSSEDEAMKKSLKMLSVESSFIVQCAEIAKEKAAHNIVELEGEDVKESHCETDHSPVTRHEPQLAALDGDVAKARRKKKLIKERKRKKRKKLEASQNNGVKP